MATHEALVDSILELVRELAVARTTRAPDPWLEVGITMAQLKTVFVLRHRGALRIGTIGDLLDLSPNATTAMLDRMEECGLVRRRADTHDRRAVLVELQPDGEALFERLQAAGLNPMRRWLDGMRTDDLAALRRGMAALLERVRDETEQVEPATETGAASA